jgi:reactive chlorine resistance protein C
MSNHTNAASLTQRLGRAVALLGVVLPLLWIGGMKFSQIDIDALWSIISTPWLSADEHER